MTLASPAVQCQTGVSSEYPNPSDTMPPKREMDSGVSHLLSLQALITHPFMSGCKGNAPLETFEMLAVN